MRAPEDHADAQTTDTILMVRPKRFGFDIETAASNQFMARSDLEPGDVAAHALAEFEAAVDQLQRAGVRVLVMEDSSNPIAASAIFPNNWLSTHADGAVVLYPMLAPSRRGERSQLIIDDLRRQFRVSRILDLSSLEQEGEFMEGTGSLVLDHMHRVCYVCRSPRSTERALDRWCAEMDFVNVAFDAVDAAGTPIYHTNVMMCVGEQFAAIVLDSIPNSTQRRQVLSALESSGRNVIELSMEQMSNFAGNMLQLRSTDGGRILAMSRRAADSLREDQLNALEPHGCVVAPDIPTIEQVGGGSIRCMITEVFLPPAHDS